MTDSAASADKISRDKRLVQRLATLTEETDRLALSTDERSRGVDGKSSFLAVAAGVVIAAVTQHGWELPWFVVSIPLVLSAIAVGASALALRPVKRIDMTPKLLAATWLDSEASTAAVEKSILLAKVSVAEAREENLRARGIAVSTGFVVLFLAVAALATVFAVDLAVTER